MSQPRDSVPVEIHSPRIIGLRSFSDLFLVLRLQYICGHPLLKGQHCLEPVPSHMMLGLKAEAGQSKG